MAETTGLLNRRTGHSVPGVRIPLSPHKILEFRGVVQLVVCLVWDQEVVGSSPATPTKWNKIPFKACKSKDLQAFFMMRLACA